MPIEAIISTRLLTISDPSLSSPSIKIERWNQINLYHPTPASLTRIMMMVAGIRPLMRFEYEFPKSVKYNQENVVTLLVKGRPHEIQF